MNHSLNCLNVNDNIVVGDHKLIFVVLETTNKNLIYESRKYSDKHCINRNRNFE